MLFEINDLVVVAEGELKGKVAVVIDTIDLKDGCYVQLIGQEDAIYFENDELEFATGMDGFEAYLLEALENETPWMYVLVEMPNTSDEEIIINPITNFEEKLEFYKKQYDAEMKHKYVEGLRIVGYGFCESLAEIEERINDRFDYGEDDEVELTKDEPKFKIGDKIIVVNDLDMPEINGTIGKITAIDETSKYQYDTNIKGQFYTLSFNKSEIALVDESEIVEGDKVVVSGVTDGYAKYNGKTGEVVKFCSKSKWEYDVKIGEESYAFGKGELIKIK